MVQTPSNKQLKHFISQGYVVAIFIFALTLPIRPFFLENILSYSTILLLIFSLAKIFINKEFELKSRWKQILFCSSLFIWWSLTLIYSSNLDLGLKYLETKLVLILLPLFILTVNPISKKQFLKLLRVYALGISFYLLLSYFLVIIQNYNYNELNKIVFPFYMYHSLVHFIGMHATYMAIQVAFAIIIVIDILIRDVQEKHHKFFNYLWLSFLAFALLSLTVKMISLACISAIIVYAVFKLGFKSSLRILGPLGLVVIISIVILSNHSWFKQRFGQNKIELIEDFSKDPQNKNGSWGSINMRHALAVSSWDVIKNNPILGVGIGDEKVERRESFKKYNFQFALNRDFNEHNQYLNIWLNSGAIGLILLLTQLLFPMVKAMKRKEILFMSFLIIVSIAFLSENYLSRQIGVAFYAFFYCLFWQQILQSNQTISHNSV